MERLLRVNRTLLEKLTDTAYIVPQEEVAAMESLTAFTTAYPDVPSLIRIFSPRPGTRAERKTPNGVLLYFAELLANKKSIGKGQVAELITILKEERMTSAYLIADAELSTEARKILQEAKAIYRIVHFTYDELMFNVTKHKRVPKHELLSVTEADEWLQATKLKRSQLPRILESDPQAKYHDAVHGELMRVTNPSVTVGQFPRHLVVVRAV